MRKILVIDDDILVRDTIVRMLKAAGYEVVSAEDGRRGLAVFQSFKPDLVVTDIIMPVKDGIETIRDIRAIAPKAQIIAFSGGVRTGNTNLLTMAHVLGASAVIVKPFDPDDFLGLVRRRLAAA